MTEKEDWKEQELQEREADHSAQMDAENEKDVSGEKENDPQLEEIHKELAELKDQNLRLYAEFENFRRRTAKERVELFGTANQELMDAMLPVLDDFRRAMKAQADQEGTEGFRLIYNKLENTLKNKGLKPMEETTGQEFDVDSMEAITRIPAPEKKLKGKVIDEVERGYMLGSKILRYAKVVVGE